MISVIGYTGGYSNSNYNAVVSVDDVTDDSDIGNEPVTLQEVKDYLRLEGFVDIDASTADDLSDFAFDDNLIEDIIIPGSRQLIEEKTGLDFIRKTREVVFNKLSGDMRISPGPIVSVTSLFDRDGVEIASTGYEINGDDYISGIYGKYMKITYESGYVTLPAALKLDLLRLCAYMYENRGDDPSIQSFASQIASKYSRNTPII
jgi:hypothetical protein